jgi:Tfp pilus assembly protein PilO
MNISTSGSKPVAMAMNVRERTRGWLNALNLHWAGVALLALVNVYLIIQMGVAWKTAGSGNADALAAQQVQLKTAQIAAKPLEGLDVKLATASEQADKFYKQRLPVSYSEIASELGALKTKTKVRLSRVGYSQPLKGTATAGSAIPTAASADGKLTEVLLDASLTGDYRGLVEFINGLERDKVFFLIDGVTLTGQQTGLVSLRIRMTTYLRGDAPAGDLEKTQAADAGDSPLSDLDKAAEAQAAKAKASTGKQGGAR